ncbi:MAG: SHOCT domain-containing protein [Caulobacteraceae bacterium]
MRFLYGCGFGGAGLGGGGFAMMLILLLLIGLVIYLVFKAAGNNNNIRNMDSTLEILNERFVNGEIGEDEYKKKKALLLKR